MASLSSHNSTHDTIASSLPPHHITLKHVTRHRCARPSRTEIGSSPASSTSSPASPPPAPSLPTSSTPRSPPRSPPPPAPHPPLPPPRAPPPPPAPQYDRRRVRLRGPRKPHSASHTCCRAPAPAFAPRLKINPKKMPPRSPREHRSLATQGVSPVSLAPTPGR